MQGDAPLGCGDDEDRKRQNFLTSRDERTSPDGTVLPGVTVAPAATTDPFCTC